MKKMKLPQRIAVKKK